MNLRQRDEKGVIKIALFESYSNGKEEGVIKPFPFTTISNSQAYMDHARNTLSIIRKFVPNAEVYLLPFHSNSARRFVAENDFQIANISLATPAVYPYMEEISEKTFIAQAVGNDGERGEVEGAVWEKCCAVGSVYSLMDPVSSSGHGKGAVDTVAEVGLDYGYGKMYGTSFAAPVITGLVAQYMIWYNRTTGSWPSVNNCVKFVKLNSQDIFEDGKDLRTGWGLLRLPKKFVASKLIITEGERLAKLIEYTEGETDKESMVDLLTNARIVDNRMVAPLRGTANAFGLQVSWDGELHQASFLD